MSISAYKYVKLKSELFSVDGAGSTVELAADFSNPNEEYVEIRPSVADGGFMVHTITFRLEDGTSATGALLGGITALSTGFSLTHVRGTGASPTTLATLTPKVIKSNADLMETAGKAEFYNDTSYGLVIAELDLDEVFGSPILLDPYREDALRVYLSEDLSGLTSFTITAKGYVAGLGRK